ncbi:MAG: polysaccharide deacetylase family protein [Silanimonas sp.]
MTTGVPVLTYHAGLVDGNDYASNDHVALAADLRVIAGTGRRVVPLQWVVDALLGRRDWSTLEGAVALSCDDGTAFDAVRGRIYGAHGPQPSLLGVLEDWVAEAPAVRAEASITSFVIASPDAREAMDRACLFGAGDLGDDWWRDARSGGRMVIGSHSWDHNHPSLPSPSDIDLPRGDFFAIDSEIRAEFEIAQAQRFFVGALGQAPSLFAYPFGHVPAFLRDDWLPRRGPGLGLDAAFDTVPAHVVPGANAWALPRYVCRWHWRSPEGLARLLDTGAPGA